MLYHHSDCFRFTNFRSNEVKLSYSYFSRVLIVTFNSFNILETSLCIICKRNGWFVIMGKLSGYPSDMHVLLCFAANQKADKRKTINSQWNVCILIITKCKSKIRSFKNTEKGTSVKFSFLECVWNREKLSYILTSSTVTEVVFWRRKLT